MKQQLTEEQIKVKVAELCGTINATRKDLSEICAECGEVWGKHSAGVRRNACPNGYPWGLTMFKATRTYRLNGIPNYPRDLNACAEMERTLGKKYGQFHDELLNITPTPEVMSSSALQRCLAFLAVHGIDASLSK